MSFIQTLLSFFRVKQQISSIDLKINRMKLRKEQSNERLEEALIRLSKIEQTYLAEIAKTRIVISDSRLIQSRLEETIESLRDELRTASDITIPGLVAANRLFIERWEAESKIQVLRGTFADNRHQKEE